MNPSPKTVAVLLSGMMRTFWFNAKNIMERLIVPNNADVFIYGGSDRTPGRANVSNSSLSSRRGTPLDFDEPAFFRECLGRHLVAMRVIEDEPEDYRREFLSIFPRGPHCQAGAPCAECSTPTPDDNRIWHVVDAYLRLRRCNEMRKRHEAAIGRRYDTIVRLRSDCRLSFTLSINDYDCKDFDLHIEGAHPPLQRDCFFFGGAQIMEHICQGFLSAYGTMPGTDLTQFATFLANAGANIRCLDADLQHFRANPSYDRRQGLGLARSCSCCMAGGSEGVSVSLDHENAIAARFGITASTVFLI